MKASAPKRELQPFSMSFLDLLACTLGALIFIMILLFLQLSGLVEEPPEVRRHREASERGADLDKRIAKAKAQAAALTEDAEDEERRAARARKEAESAAEDLRRTREMAENDPVAVEKRLREEAAALDREMEDADRERSELERRTRLARERVEKARKDLGAAGVVVPFAAPGKNDHAKHISEIYHVVCESDAVVITHAKRDARGGFTKRGTWVNSRVPLDRLKDPDSAFQAMLKEAANQPTRSVVFWVRPEGIRTYDHAEALLRKSADGGVKIEHGDEPADKDWKFNFGGLEK